jgi:hypothetical protein
MRKILTAAVAALTIAGGMAASVTTAEARPYDRHRHHRGNDHGDAVVAGIAGLAIGAALAGSSRDRGYYRGGYYQPRHRYYRGRYDDRRYYRSGYYAPRYAYRECRTVRVWDPYYGRSIRERRCW